MPNVICTRTRAETTQKYLIVARCDGVATAPSRGSRSGTASGAGSCLRAAYHHAMPPTAARSRITLTPVHTSASGVTVLPTSGSCGQLLVYVTVSSGRSVVAAQADQ